MKLIPIALILLSTVGADERAARIKLIRSIAAALTEYADALALPPADPDPPVDPEPPPVDPPVEPEPEPDPDPPAPPSANAVVLFDFEDSVLHDAKWLWSQPRGTAGHFVAPRSGTGKGKGGPDTMSLAIGQGRNGGNALLLEHTDRPPGFWVLRGESTGGSHGNLSDERGYLAPRGKRVNRIEFWVRFDIGYRSASAATDSENMHVGTYHFDPAKLPGIAKESDNWHFYHQLTLRHDKALAGWIHVVVNDVPTHQRSLSKIAPTKNPTAWAGDYVSLLTRFYVEGVPYTALPLGGKYRMWVDDIKLSYADERPGVSVEMGGDTARTLTMAKGETLSVPVTIVNESSSAVSGKLSHRVPYWLQPKLSKSGPLTIAPGSSVSMSLDLQPQDNLRPGVWNAGVLFVPDVQSPVDPNVETRKWPQGPPDAVTAGNHVRISVK